MAKCQAALPNVERATVYPGGATRRSTWPATALRCRRGRPDVRILFTTHGAYGHFHPIAPLALAALTKGHDVLVATGPDLTDWVARCGLRSVAAGPAVDVMNAAVAQLAVDPARPAMFHLFSTVAVPPTLADLRRLADEWHPDLVVHEEGEYAAPLLAALEGIPCVTHSWAAPARPAVERQLYRELLGPIWGAHGAPSPPRTSGSLYLDSCPPPYQTDEIGSIEGATSIRPTLFDGPPTPVPPWLENLPRPAAYVTFGTVSVFSRPEVIRAAVEAIQPLVASVVVTTGPNPRDAVRFSSANVHVVDYLPQSRILARVDLVASHGGAGTTQGALAHGLPHLVMPGIAPSQQRNAARTEAVGLGLRASLDGPADGVREAAWELLADPAFRAACRVAQASLEQLPSVDDALELVTHMRS